jgi:hypothetical protein
MGSKEMMQNHLPYRSKVCAIVHEAMRGLFGDALIDQTTMRMFDTLCLSRSDGNDGGGSRRSNAVPPQANYRAASFAEKPVFASLPQIRREHLP